MLYQSDTEILFPVRLINSLRNLRGPLWQDLIDHLSPLEESNIDVLAFSLMMIRINNCINCHADSFRALRGCTTCTHQTLNRYRGTDEELIALWKEARREIIQWRDTNPGVLKKYLPPTLAAST